MTMEKLKKCRICLVENVRMIVVADKNLQDIYEKLSDVPFVTEDSRPMLACFLCCSKLKQSYQLQRKCLEAEELFSQMLNEDYKTKPLTNQGQLEFRSGFTITPTVHLSIANECQTESIAIKKELPAVCEGLDDIIEPKKEHQTYELELENFDNSCLDVADIVVPPYHPESDLEDNVPLMEIKIEVEEEEVSKQEPTASEFKNSITIKEELPDVCEELDDIIEPKEEQQFDEPEPENDNSCLDVANYLVPLYHSESDLEDEVPLMEYKTEVEVEQEVSMKKRRAGDTKRSDTDSEYECGAPGPSTKKKLLTEVHKKCVTTYSRQDFKPSEIQSTDNESQRLNKAAKTAAERGREYRARKSLLKQQRKEQQERDAIVEIAYSNSNILYIRRAGPSEDNQVLGPSEIERRAKSAEATRRWREKKEGFSESSKKQAKTAAQRMREYRQRKKLAKKILLKQQSDQDLDATVSTSSSQVNQRAGPSTMNSISAELTRRGNSRRTYASIS